MTPGGRAWGGLASWGSVFCHELRCLSVRVLGGFCLGGEVDGPHGLEGHCRSALVPRVLTGCEMEGTPGCHHGLADAELIPISLSPWILGWPEWGS